MSLFIATSSKKPSKVHYSLYIQTENKPTEEPTSPPKPSEDPKPDVQ